MLYKDLYNTLQKHKSLIVKIMSREERIKYNLSHMQENPDPKYKKWLDSIINRAIGRVKEEGILYERHHIKPRCIGGNNSKENLVYLTIKEHVLVHKLLTMAYPHCPGFSLAVRAMMLEKKSGRVGEKYFSLREIVFYKERAANAMKNRRLTEEEKRRISERNKGQRAWNKGISMSEEFKEKLRKIRESRTPEENAEIQRKKSETQKGNPPTVYKNVIGPDGTVYKSQRAAGDAYGVSYVTIRNWIKFKPEKGFKYGPEQKNKRGSKE